MVSVPSATEFASTPAAVTFVILAPSPTKPPAAVTAPDTFSASVTCIADESVEFKTFVFTVSVDSPAAAKVV